MRVRRSIVLAFAFERVRRVRHVRVRRQRRLRSIIPRRASLVRHEEGSFRGGFDATRHVSGDDSRPRAASRVRVPSVRGERRGTVPTVVGVSRRDGRRAARRARASSRRRSTKRRGGVCVARAGGRRGGVFRRRKRRRRRKYFFRRRQRRRRRTHSPSSRETLARRTTRESSPVDAARVRPRGATRSHPGHRVECVEGLRGFGRVLRRRCFVAFAVAEEEEKKTGVVRRRLRRRGLDRGVPRVRRARDGVRSRSRRDDSRAGSRG